MATDRTGRWVAVWSSADSLGGTIGTDTDILVVRSTDGGVSWSAPAPLNSNAATDAGFDERPQISTDGAGRWIAVWSSNNTPGGTVGDADIMVSRSSDGGVTWTSAVPLNTNAGTDSVLDSEPRIAGDGAGHWIVAWSSGSFGGAIEDWDILIGRSSDNGVSWSAPLTLTSYDVDPADNRRVTLTTDKKGVWLVAWRAFHGLNGTIGDDGDILLSRSANNGASWTNPVPLNANAATDSAYDSFPDLATDGLGNWLAVWETTRPAGGFMIVSARSGNKGATWSAPVPLDPLDTTLGEGAYDDQPKLTTDGAGNWVAVWHRSPIASGGNWIVTSHSTNDGMSWLPASRFRHSDADLLPQVASDGARGWIVVWTATGSGSDYDIRFAHGSPLRDRLVVDFGAPHGVWALWEDGVWGKIHSLSPESLTPIQPGIVMDFGSTGVWWRAVGFRNSTFDWQRIHQLSPDETMGCDHRYEYPQVDEIVMDFGVGKGVWMRQEDASWEQLHPLSPESMLSGYLLNYALEDVVLDLGATHGVWRRYEGVPPSGGSWEKLHPLSPEAMTRGSVLAEVSTLIDEMYLDFGPAHGVWVRQQDSAGTAFWDRVHVLSPETMGVRERVEQSVHEIPFGVDDLILDFGPGHGFWSAHKEWPSFSWEKMHDLSPRSFVTCDLDGNGMDEIIADFGAPHGIWTRRDNRVWQRVHSTTAKQMACVRW